MEEVYQQLEKVLAYNGLSNVKIKSILFERIENVKGQKIETNDTSTAFMEIMDSDCPPHCNVEIDRSGKIECKC
ncbi:hypothetical protein AB9P05_19790 [Roseivirga sp. BDSF3-8]|uniref:hypothetical protein n=1 Tax=Roseivirga sp. BDSF3-8 TaxID=3241598 RepID=UPI003531A860